MGNRTETDRVSCDVRSTYAEKRMQKFLQDGLRRVALIPIV